MAVLSANQGWFEVKIEGGPGFGVFSLKGREKLNQPYEFELELVSRNAEINLADLLGRQAFLTLADHSGGKRKVHGSIRQTEQLHTANAFTHYRILIVPRLWYLGQNRNHRIFQHQSAVQIMEQIFKEQGFVAESLSWKLKEQYAEREYCVQYGESDLHFISRLCEEEGIYFYFEHSDKGHTLCFSDASGGSWIPEEVGGELRFFAGSGQQADGAVIRKLNLRQRINSDAASYREWNFEKPPLDLSVLAGEPDQKKAPTPGGLNLETYQYPHLYQLSEPGDRFANLQLLRQLTFSKWVEGDSDVTRLLPGFAFKLHSHPRTDVNAQWWLTEVEHFGEQPQVLEHEAPDRGFVYQNRFTAIPFETRFVPEIKHPKKRVDGLQSAIVTGPSGEEVYVDKYGRVKVHFHWDRLGPMTEHSTCWVRVADSWAGHNFGFIQAPRIGQEVIVEFMEGDPDRPVITGRVYNTDKMPPWALPAQKTLSGLQSREFKGGQRNQLVFDDTEGQVQAQLSSDHELSQLNLGYLTRVNHIEGRKDFRGEGFELRTDGWGAIRAAKGLFISTDARPQAEEHQKDLREAFKNIETSTAQHIKNAELAEIHSAYDHGSEVKPVSDKLNSQKEQIKGDGQTHNELSDPQMVFSSPSGMVFTTPESSHIHTGETLALTSERHMSVSASRSILFTALKKIALFAYEKGIRIFSAKGKVEIHSQANDLDVIAAEKLQIISANGKVHISSPKEIILTAGGSYIKINSNGIEQGTPGKWEAYAAAHNLNGPRSQAPLTVSWQTAEPELTPKVTVFDPLGRKVDVDRYAADNSGDLDGKSDEHDLKLFTESESEDPKTIGNSGNREILADSLNIKLSKDKAVEDE